MDRAHRLGQPVAAEPRLWRPLSISAAVIVGVLALVAQTAAQDATSGKGDRVRVIAPSIITGPQFDPGTLERIAPRAPLHQGETAPEKAKGEEGTMLFRPVASAAGRFRADGHTITIAGIQVVEPDRVCGNPHGSTWPCGRQARTAFRSWLRGRAVRCDLAHAKRFGGAEVASCSLGGDDVGAWLVANGWALAEPDGPYSQAGKTAREARKGVFGGRFAP